MNLHELYYDKDLDRIKEQIKNGSSYINEVNEDTFTLLMMSARDATNPFSENLLIFLINENADLNIQSNFNENFTALMLATYNSNKDAVIALLKAGANQHIRTNQNNRALEIAINNEYQEITSILREYFIRTTPSPIPDISKNSKFEEAKSFFENEKSWETYLKTTCIMKIERK